MNAVKYVLNFLIIFCLISAIWIKTLGVSINPATLVFLAILFLILRLFMGQTEKK